MTSHSHEKSVVQVMFAVCDAAGSESKAGTSHLKKMNDGFDQRGVESFDDVLQRVTLRGIVRERLRHAQTCLLKQPGWEHSRRIS